MSPTPEISFLIDPDTAYSNCFYNYHFPFCKSNQQTHPMELGSLFSSKKPHLGTLSSKQNAEPRRRPAEQGRCPFERLLQEGAPKPTGLSPFSQPRHQVEEQENPTDACRGARPSLKARTQMRRAGQRVTTRRSEQRQGTSTPGSAGRAPRHLPCVPAGRPARNSREAPAQVRAELAPKARASPSARRGGGPGSRVLPGTGDEHSPS